MSRDSKPVNERVTKLHGHRTRCTEDCGRILHRNRRRSSPIFRFTFPDVLPSTAPYCSGRPVVSYAFHFASPTLIKLALWKRKTNQTKPTVIPLPANPVLIPLVPLLARLRW